MSVVSALRDRTTFTKTSDLASTIGVSRAFLEQIMRNLRMAGILSVKRGPGGGYALNPDRESFTALDVANAVGNTLGSLTTDSGSDTYNRLTTSIIEAFLNTTL